MIKKQKLAWPTWWQRPVSPALWEWISASSKSAWSAFLGYTERPSLKAKQKCRRRRKRGKEEEKEKAQKPAAPRPGLYTITSILASEVTEELLGLSLLL